MAFVLTPEPPIADWLSELDDWIRSSTGYFVGRPVVLDLSSVMLSGGGIAHLVSELSARDIRVMGLEATGAADLAPGLHQSHRGEGEDQRQQRTVGAPAVVVGEGGEELHLSEDVGALGFVSLAPCLGFFFGRDEGRGRGTCEGDVCAF